VLDAIIEAMRRQDAQALLALTDFEQVACVAASEGIGGPPLCRPSEAPGTLVAVLTTAQCEGGPARRDELTVGYTRLLEQRREIFAVTDRGERETQYSFGRGRYELVFEEILGPADSPERHITSSVAVTANDRGITLLRFGCGFVHAAQLISPGREPEFVIEPTGWDG
jgi:hypothetical protein